MKKKGKQAIMDTCTKEWILATSVFLITWLCFFYNIKDAIMSCSISSADCDDVAPSWASVMMSQDDEVLFTFIHATDIHIHDPSLDVWDGLSTRNYRDFVTKTIPEIRPRVVVLGGDLTNAKKPSGILKYKYSEQMESEWQLYRNITSLMKRMKMKHETILFDVPGNHDCLDVDTRTNVDPALRNDFYSRYTQGMSTSPFDILDHKRLIAVDEINVNKNLKVRFIGVHAGAQPGFHMPFNFFGALDAKTVNQLREVVQKPTSTPMVTVLYMHFPPSTILFESSQARNDFLNLPVDIRLSGHLHSLLGAAKHGLRSQTRIKDSKHILLERETPSLWLEHSFRLFLVTPSNVYEQLCIVSQPCAILLRPKFRSKAGSSSVIRIAWFQSETSSPKPLHGYVDGDYVGQLNEVESKDNMHIMEMPWDPSDSYAHGYHDILISLDEQGQDVIVRQDFCLEECHSRLNPQYVAEAIMLYSNFPRLAVQLVILALSAALVLLGMSYSILYPSLFLVDRTLWITLVAFTLILLFGPWFIVPELTSSAQGSCWFTIFGVHGGKLADPARLFRSDPYLHMVFYLYFCFLPLLWFVVFDLACVNIGHRTIFRKIFSLGLCLISIRKAVLWVLELGSAYGILSAIVSPVAFGSVVLWVFVFWRYWRLQQFGELLPTFPKAE